MRLITLQILSILKERYVEMIVKESLKHWHAVGDDEEKGDFIEITQELKEAFEKDEWISSENIFKY